MKRIQITPRPQYQQTLDAQGLSFHSWDNYWKEDACYQFTLKQVEEIEAATEELNTMCVAAVKFAIENNRLHQFGLTPEQSDLVKRSFQRQDFNLYARFDFAYDGVNPPKLLEYNSDTPTSLLESAVCQWFWMEDKFPHADQFNSLHERLIERWKSAPGTGVVHLACIKDNEEDWVCATYMRDLVEQAGRQTKFVYIEDIGWDADNKLFVDLDNQPIDVLFKLYPWEWLSTSEFAKHTPESKTVFIEPAWKLPMASKGLLPLLWELYPNHPNLLPAYYTQGTLTSYAKKPLFSREGANVQLWKDGQLIAQDEGPYGEEGYVYQELMVLPEFDNFYPVIGSWVVGDEPAGMCIREDTKKITTNMSHFVPHYFES